MVVPQLLTVLSPEDTFASVWSELAERHGLRLQRLNGAGELEPDTSLLPPIIVAVGRERQAETDLRELRARGLTPLVVSSTPDHRLAVAFMRAGAAEFFALPADLDLLRSFLDGKVETAGRDHERARFLELARTRYDFSQIIGKSAAVRDALERAARVIPHPDANVLVTGETGTGKELLARAIHFNGPRAAGAFVEINCAAIPDNLLESELFGYERGAFTDARTTKPGLFEAANEGTLFLDEIGHLPVPLQGKLLKALEERRVRRIGALEPRAVDFRVIAATNVDLLAAVEAGEFREDLYYRLAVIPIHLPPLRDRGRDIVLLAEHFLSQLARRYGKEVPTLDGTTRAALVARPWYGNARELRNALERALLLGNDRLNPADLFIDSPNPQKLPSNGIPFPAPLDAIQREAARRMLDRVDGNKSAAAAALGISRSRLYRLIGRNGAESLPTPGR